MKKKKFQRIWAALLACLTLWISMPAVRTAASDTSYQAWKQYDSRWGSVAVGSGTMASIGCKITSIAILMVHAGIQPDDVSVFHPGLLCMAYAADGYLDSSGNLNTGAALSQTNSPEFYKAGAVDVSAMSFEEICGEIQTLTDTGYYLDVRVANGGHFAAVNCVEGEDVLIMDPGYDKTLLSEWDGTITQLNYYQADPDAEQIIYTTSVTESTETTATEAISPPTYSVASLDKTVYAVGEPVVFYAQGDGNHALGIDNEDTGARICSPIIGTEETYTYTFVVPGQYSYYVTTFNDAGLVNSDRVYFQITGASGDLNGDGTADSDDALLILRAYTALLLGQPSQLTEEQLAAADRNASGAIDSDDAVLILLAYAEQLLGHGA